MLQRSIMRFQWENSGSWDLLSWCFHEAPPSPELDCQEEPVDLASELVPSRAFPHLGSDRYARHATIARWESNRRRNTRASLEVAQRATSLQVAEHLRGACNAGIHQSRKTGTAVP